MALGRKTGGKKKGTKNRATLAKEAAALEALKNKAVASMKGPPRGRGKDELEMLVPVVKGAVAHFQRDALGEDGSGAPGKPNFDPRKWERLKEWFILFERICFRTAEFQDPRFGVVAVAAMPGAPTAAPAGPAPKIIDQEPMDESGRANRARETYLRLVKSSRDSAA
jgi:hypothetical protein